MIENYICLEGIAHDRTLDMPLEDWRRLLDLGRWYGWKLPDEKLWVHFYTPIPVPEPLPAKQARDLADSLEGALVSQCTHNQYHRDERAPAMLVTWSSTTTAAQTIRSAIALLRLGGLYVSAGTV